MDDPDTDARRCRNLPQSYHDLTSRAGRDRRRVGLVPDRLTRIDQARLEQRLVLSPVNSVIYC